MTWRDEIRKHLCEEWPWAAMDEDGQWNKFAERPNWYRAQRQWAVQPKCGKWASFIVEENINLANVKTLTSLEGLETSQFSLLDLRVWEFPINWYKEITNQLIRQPDDPPPGIFEAIDVSYVKNERARKWISDKLKELYG